MKRQWLGWMMVFMLLVGAWSPARAATNAVTGAELIMAVNSLRTGRGLAQLRSDPILNQVAQAHAEYLASIRSMTHYSADGSRPYQRALAAGYPVGGTVSLGGYFSENIVMLSEGDSAQDAIDIWMGDAPHQKTMLSTDRNEIGAGVAYADGMYYVVIDTSLRGSQNMATATPASGNAAPTQGPSVISGPSATLPSGTIVHIVASGETLWTIAQLYQVTVDEVLSLNYLKASDYLQVGQKLLIRLPFTATPGAAASATPTPSPSAAPTAPPTPTASLEPTSLPTPTATAIATATAAAVAALSSPAAEQAQPEAAGAPAAEPAALPATRASLPPVAVFALGVAFGVLGVILAQNIIRLLRS